MIKCDKYLGNLLAVPATQSRWRRLKPQTLLKGAQSWLRMRRAEKGGTGSIVPALICAQMIHRRFIYIYIYIYISISLCLSLSLLVCLSFYLSVYLSIYPSIYLSAYPSIHRSIYGSMDPSISPSIDSSFHLSIYDCI